MMKISQLGYVKVVFLVQGSACSVINWQRGTLRPDPSSAAAALTNFLYNAKSTADFKQGGREGCYEGEGESKHDFCCVFVREEFIRLQSHENLKGSAQNVFQELAGG